MIFESVLRFAFEIRPGLFAPTGLFFAVFSILPGQMRKEASSDRRGGGNAYRNGESLWGGLFAAVRSFLTERKNAPYPVHPDTAQKG